MSLLGVVMQVVRGKGHGRHGVGVVGCCPDVERISVTTGAHGRAVKVCPCAYQKHYVDAMYRVMLVELNDADCGWFRAMVNAAAAGML